MILYNNNNLLTFFLLNKYQQRKFTLKIESSLIFRFSLFEAKIGFLTNKLIFLCSFVGLFCPFNELQKRRKSYGKQFWNSPSSRNLKWNATKISTEMQDRVSRWSFDPVLFQMSLCFKMHLCLHIRGSEFSNRDFIFYKR